VIAKVGYGNAVIFGCLQQVGAGRDLDRFVVYGNGHCIAHAVVLVLLKRIDVG
jgi:hypothetical protein